MHKPEEIDHYTSINSHLPNHASSLMRGTVKTVSPFLSQSHSIALPRTVQKILIAHRYLRNIDAGGHLILVENHVVGEPGVVLENDFLPGSDGEGAGLENQPAVIGPEQNVDGHGVSGEHCASCGGNHGSAELF